MIGFFHISDLHFGPQPRPSKGFRRKLEAMMTFGSASFKGHDFQVAENLANWWRKQTLTNPTRWWTLMTGDLTAQGSGREFGCGHRYLHANWEDLFTGLGAGPRTFTIPGNHDFWNGSFANSAGGAIIQREILPPHFRPLPWLEVIRDPDGPPLEVHIVGLDTSSGLPTTSLDHAFAKGNVAEKDLEYATWLLDESLRDVEENHLVIRIVLAHHPPNHLTNETEMWNWMNTNHIHILLTGHTHEPDSPGVNDIAPPYEFRCGTTTQLSNPMPNHFFAHTLTRESQRSNYVIWKTQEYWNCPGIGKWLEAENPSLQNPGNNDPCWLGKLTCLHP